MSGHSKWSQIKRKKEIKDKQKGTIFSKLSRLITLAVVEGGGISDPEKNIKLRLAVEKAKAENMPKENIKRAIDNGIGSNKSLIKEVVYEAFGPNKVALIILTATDNPNRTLAEIRNVLERDGGKLGVKGSVAYLFKKCGIVIFDKTDVPEDKVFQFAEKIDAFDIDQDGTTFTVYIPFENLGKVKDNLNGLSPQTTEVDYKPTSFININNKDSADKILKLVEDLESLEDVSHAFGNFNIADDCL